MKNLLKSSILAGLVLLTLIASGCARARSETPTPTRNTQQVDTPVPASVDGTPTVLTVVATATQPPIIGTPTPLILNTPTPSTAATSQTGTGSGSNAETSASPPPPPPTPISPNPTTTTGSGSEIVHIVQPGENLFRIGIQYGVDAATLAAYNGISDPTLIYVGQKIRIPVSGSGYTGSSGQIYVVQPGDTLYTIATSFNITVQALMNANGITNPDMIYIGQQLTVP